MTGRAPSADAIRLIGVTEVTYYRWRADKSLAAQLVPTTRIEQQLKNAAKSLSDVAATIMAEVGAAEVF